MALSIGVSGCFAPTTEEPPAEQQTFYEPPEPKPSKEQQLRMLREASAAEPATAAMDALMTGSGEDGPVDHISGYDVTWDHAEEQYSVLRFYVDADSAVILQRDPARGGPAISMTPEAFLMVAETAEDQLSGLPFNGKRDAVGFDSEYGLTVSMTRTFNIIGLASVLLLVAGTIMGAGIAFGRWRSKTLNRRKMDEHTRFIDELEADRKRMSDELHDGPLQALYSLAQRLDPVEGHTSQADVDFVAEMIRNVSLDIRSCVYDLKPPMLALLGLDRCVKNVVGNMSEVYPLVESTYESNVDPDVKLNDQAETHLFRMLHEGISNAYRHAAPTMVHVFLRIDEGGIRAVVDDNGRGIEAGSASSGTRDDSGGVGLSSLRTRANSLGGTITLSARPNGIGSRLEFVCALGDVQAGGPFGRFLRKLKRSSAAQSRPSRGRLAEHPREPGGSAPRRSAAQQ